MPIIKVRCSFVIEVEVPDYSDYDLCYEIEERGCPGTGIVGNALDLHVEKHSEAGTCWACALGGKNEIVP